YPRASALLSEVVAAKPQDVSLYFPLALSLLEDGKTEAPNHVSEHMVPAGGNTPQLDILFSQAFYERGGGGKAMEGSRTALALDDKVRMAHFYSGLIHLKAGKLAEAEREIESELALNPKDIQARYHLAFVTLEQQQIERGIKLMREVVAA